MSIGFNFGNYDKYSKLNVENQGVKKHYGKHKNTMKDPQPPVSLKDIYPNDPFFFDDAIKVKNASKGLTVENEAMIEHMRNDAIRREKDKLKNKANLEIRR